MGLSGGGSSKSYSGSGQKWATPIAKQAAADTTSVFNSAQPGLQNITNSVQGTIPSILAKYQAGNPALNTATSWDVNLLNRDPFAGSPQLDNLVNSTDAHVGDQVNANFGSRGAFGGTAHTTALARALADNETGLRYQDAQNIIGQQGAASANAPQKAAADYLGISPYLAAAQTGAALPYTGINAQATDLNNLFAGGTQKTTQPSGLGAALGQAFGTGASLLGFGAI